MSAAPIPVAVTRPKLTGRAAVVKLLTALITLAGDAYVVMLAAAALTPWHPSYWNAALAVVGVRALQGRGEFMAWTHEAKS